MRIALVHDSLNPCGGAERLTLAMARALKELGHVVDLYVLEGTDWSKVERVSPYSPLVVDREYVLPPRTAFPTVYGRLVNWFARDVLGIHGIRRRRYDLVAATKQLLVPVFVDVLYMHFPDFVPGFDYLYYPERYLYNTVLRIYSRPMELASRILISFFKELEYKPLILTNSRFSASIIERFLGFKPLVLYPPVDVEKYLPLAQERNRENLVVTMGRIESMKNLDIVIDIAKEIRNAKFIVVGSLQSRKYYASLMKRIKELNLEGRVKILPNTSENLKAEILRKAKVYLHPTKYEHFGIAVVEAMAAGLIPVVHKSGGPWIDIVEEGRYGFGFSSVSEAIDHVNELLSLNKELESPRSRCVNRVRVFDYTSFKSCLKLVIERLESLEEH